VSKVAMKTTNPSLCVGKLKTGGYAVLTEDGRFKVGPNPLKKRAAEYALKVIERLGLDLRFPQPMTAAKQNSLATGRCPRLARWTMGQVR
jgi:hypothetical protein